MEENVHLAYSECWSSKTFLIIFKTNIPYINI